MEFIFESELHNVSAELVVLNQTPTQLTTLTSYVLTVEEHESCQTSAERYFVT